MTEQELILTAILGCERVDLYQKELSFTTVQQERYQDITFRRLQGEPLQYLLGETEFFGLRLQVDRRTFIPRPETEVLVETILARVQNRKAKIDILELGTGSGNIAVSLAKHLPGARIVTVDISDGALTVAKQNAVHHGVAEQILFLQADMVDFLAGRSGDLFYDCVVSNPPYIPSGQLSDLPRDVQQEPRLSLDGGVDGLKFYHPLIKAWSLLKEQGRLFFEFGDGQRRALEVILQNKMDTYSYEFVQDLSGRDRSAVLQKT